VAKIAGVITKYKEAKSICEELKAKCLEMIGGYPSLWQKSVKEKDD